MSYQILGTLTDNDGVYDEETGEVITEPTILEGYHVNTTEAIDGADEYLVTPTIPRVKFAGVETFYYSFPDESTAKQMMNYSIDEEGNEAYNPIPKSVKSVPESITKRQARQQLILMGIYDNVQPMIDAIEDDIERALANSYWNDSSIYERQHPQMVGLASALGIGTDQLDDAFIAASQL